MEERKESGCTNTGLLSPLLSVIEEPSGESREQSVAESTSIASFQTDVIHYNTSASPSCASSNRRPTPSPPPCSRADKAPPTPEKRPNSTTPTHRPLIDTKGDADAKDTQTTAADSSSNTNSTETIVEQSTTPIVKPESEAQNTAACEELSDASDEAINFIQAALQAHSIRRKAASIINSTPQEPLNSIRNRIRTARPWEKKKASLPPSLSLKEEDEVADEMSSSSSASNLSEEEREGMLSSEMLEHARRFSLQAIQGVIKGHDIRSSALQRLEADKDLFTNGKVSAMRAKFNERRRSSANATAMALEGRSDGVTDDDDDVVY